MNTQKFDVNKLTVKLNVSTGLDCNCGHHPIIKTNEKCTAYMIECQECGCHTDRFETLVECFEDWAIKYGNEVSERKALAEKIVADAMKFDISMEDAFWMADLVRGEYKDLDEEDVNAWSCIDCLTDNYFDGDHSVDVVDGFAYVIW